MKHNEVKAFFKKQVIEKFPQYTVLSIDETSSSRILYVLDKQTLETLIKIKCWFGTNEFSVYVYDAKHLRELKHVNPYKDYFTKVEGNYLQLQKISQCLCEMDNYIQDNFVNCGYSI